MKIISTPLPFLGLCLLLGISNAYADISLDSDEQIKGVWRLEYSKKNLETAKVVERSDTWVIENGKLIMKGIRQESTPVYDSIPVNYKIEEGLFKVALGRPGKFDSYTLISRTADAMVLKDRMGVFYHFKKK
jgi:hypothetical protein